MAVIETPVHELTKTGADWHPGCYNKPRTRKDLIVKAGFRLIPDGKGVCIGEQLFKTIPDFGSLECRSDCPECVGCQHFDMSYVNLVKKEGS